MFTPKMEYLSIIHARFSVFVFNLFFALTGIATLLISSAIYIQYQRYENLIGDHFWWAAVFLICAGIFIFLISTLCSCGAIKENSQIVLTFLFLLVVIFSFEIGTSVAIYHKKSQLNRTLDNSFGRILVSHEKYEGYWSMVQTQLKCCGVYGPNDWTLELNSTNLPTSCCLNFTTNCTLEIASKDGCKPVLLKYTEHMTMILASVGVGIGWIQIVVVGYACCMYYVFRKNYAQFTERLI